MLLVSSHCRCILTMQELNSRADEQVDCSTYTKLSTAVTAKSGNVAFTIPRVHKH